MQTIRRIAVLGAGTMGSRIAALFANAGIPSLLLDVVLPGQADRSAAARRGIDAAYSGKPPAFENEAARALVTPGNFEDDLGAIGEVDWVIEAVVEELAPKRTLWEQVERHAHPEAILSTNTSGLSLACIAEGRSPAFRRRFLGTHFFNPPRYLRLLELIPGPETEPALLDFVDEFATTRLGKGVVRCKDTPNFIANRMGSFLVSTAWTLMMEGDYSIEEVDALTGPLIGLPGTATFRLLDLVGLDIWASMSENLYQAVPHDPWRERFRVPAFLKEMLARGWRGRKSGGGFYRRAGEQFEVIDWKALEYHAPRVVTFPSVEAAGGIEDLPARLRALVSSEDRVGRFLRPLLTDLGLYAASRVPEISDHRDAIDRAMRWGYAHTLGPFEIADALG